MDGQVLLAERPGSQSPVIPELPGSLGMTLMLAAMLDFNQNRLVDVITSECPHLTRFWTWQNQQHHHHPLPVCLSRAVNV